MVRQFYLELTDYRPIIKAKIESLPIAIPIEHFYKLIDMFTESVYSAFVDSILDTLNIGYVFNHAFRINIYRYLVLVVDDSKIVKEIISAITPYVLHDYQQIESQVIVDDLTILNTNVYYNAMDKNNYRFLTIMVEYEQI